MERKTEKVFFLFFTFPIRLRRFYWHLSPKKMTSRLASRAWKNLDYFFCFLFTGWKIILDLSFLLHSGVRSMWYSHYKSSWRSAGPSLEWPGPCAFWSSPNRCHTLSGPILGQKYFMPQSRRDSPIAPICEKANTSSSTNK